MSIFLNIFVDGQPAPSKLLEWNFKGETYIAAYHQLFSGFNWDTRIYLSWEDVSKGRKIFLYPIRFRPDFWFMWLSPFEFATSRKFKSWNTIFEWIFIDHFRFHLCLIWKHYWHFQDNVCVMWLSKLNEDELSTD